MPRSDAATVFSNCDFRISLIIGRRDEHFGNGASAKGAACWDVDTAPADNVDFKPMGGRGLCNIDH
jgi:hypothetical protein